MTAKKEQAPSSELPISSTKESKSIKTPKSELKETPSQKNINVNANGELVTAKQKWCADRLYSNFMLDDEQVPALRQFNTFVNEICPQLDAAIPSKYRNFEYIEQVCGSLCAFHTPIIWFRERDLKKSEFGGCLSSKRHFDY